MILKLFFIGILLNLILSGNFTLIVRDEWRDYVLHPPKYVVIHQAGQSCSNKSACMFEVQKLQNSHHAARGWSDTSTVGYNFMVGEDGNIYEGHGWPTDRNYEVAKEVIGIAFLGDFTGGAPNQAAQDELKIFLEESLNDKKLDNNYKLIPHSALSQTPCPGDHILGFIKTWPHYSEEK